MDPQHCLLRYLPKVHLHQSSKLWKSMLFLIFFIIIFACWWKEIRTNIYRTGYGGPKLFGSTLFTMLHGAAWKRQYYLVGTRRRLENAAKFSGGDHHGLDLLLLVGGEGGGMISWLDGAQLFPDGWAPGADDLWHVLHCKPASHLDNTLFSWIFLKSRVADPGCLSLIKDPNFSILDPGSKRLRIPDPDQFKYF